MVGEIISSCSMSFRPKTGNNCVADFGMNSADIAESGVAFVGVIVVDAFVFINEVFEFGERENVDADDGIDVVGVCIDDVGMLSFVVFDGMVFKAGQTLYECRILPS